MLTNSYTHSHFLSTHLVLGPCKTLGMEYHKNSSCSQGAHHLVNEASVQMKKHCHVLGQDFILLREVREMFPEEPSLPASSLLVYVSVVFPSIL